MRLEGEQHRQHLSPESGEPGESKAGHRREREHAPETRSPCVQGPPDGGVLAAADTVFHRADNEEQKPGDEPVNTLAKFAPNRPCSVIVEVASSTKPMWPMLE